MLRDSGHIQEEDAAYVNKKRAKQGLPPVEPLYTLRMPSEPQLLFRLGYDRPLRVAPGTTLTFRDAGHILGSAILCLMSRRAGKSGG